MPNKINFEFVIVLCRSLFVFRRCLFADLCRASQGRELSTKRYNDTIGDARIFFYGNGMMRLSGVLCVCYVLILLSLGLVGCLTFNFTSSMMSIFIILLLLCFVSVVETAVAVLNGVCSLLFRVTS